MIEYTAGEGLSMLRKRKLTKEACELNSGFPDHIGVGGMVQVGGTILGGRLATFSGQD